MKKYLLFFLGIFLFMTLVSSEPPVTTIQQFQEGFIIEGSPQEFIKQNTDYQYNFFVYNISNGAKITNTTTACFFYLANNSGEVLYFSNVPYKIEGYFGLDISGGNFSDLGHYNYGIFCNSTTMGGALVNYFQVTTTGLETPEGIILIFFLIGFLIIIGGMLALTLNMIFRMLHLTFDATNLITMISAYFVMFGFYILETEYLSLEIINTILSILVDVGSIVFVFVPIIIFVVCYIKGNLDKVNFRGSEFD